MKAGTSSLNPYAASYIPLSRRGAFDENKLHETTTKDSKNGNQAVSLGYYPGNTPQYPYKKYAENYDVSAADTFQIPEHSKLKGNTVYGYSSSSQIPNEMAGMQSQDEDFDMDLAYLQMTFPGISDESLSEIYIANKGDMESTLDMLNQLEIYAGDFPESLPDTLDIGDIPEAGSSSDSAALKLKKVAGEGSGSSIS